MARRGGPTLISKVKVCASRRHHSGWICGLHEIAGSYHRVHANSGLPEFVTFRGMEMTIAKAQLFHADASPSDQSLRALDAVNFFVAGALAGFGPFVAVFLGEQGWSQEE